MIIANSHTAYVLLTHGHMCRCSEIQTHNKLKKKYNAVE